ncbi:unnamed protein product [Linum trigynum]|uniref:Uncharacterized protein n=1 Tax=Linum trigynum TaxID=586398 RepID=A0AAV2EMK8_9ROSI
MEKREIGTKAGSSSRESDLMKSFSLAIRSLLTGCSNEDFLKAFSRFSRPEQEWLRRLYIQVITSLHQRIENEFQDLCGQLQVRTILDTVEQLVEEQTLDPFFLDKSNVVDVSSSLSNTKEEEIQYLMGVLQKAEEQNRTTRDHIDLLKTAKKGFSRTQIL